MDGRRLGSLAHTLIAECLRDGVRQPSHRELIERAGRHALANDRRTVYRQAAKQALLTTASIYFRWFAPPSEWALIGAEVSARGCRFDLVWQVDAQVIADELKTGSWVNADDDQALLVQVDRLVRAGVAKYGDSFRGVRVILLGAPQRSYLALPLGDRGRVL